MPEGYVVPLIGGGTATLTSDTITAGPREWIPAEHRTETSRSWTGQLARRPYPQVIPNTMLRPHGSMNYNSLQTKLERRFSDGLALSMGYTWSKAMAMNYNGNWGDWSGSRDYERHALRAPMQHDRSSTYYMSAIWELPFFKNAGGVTKSLLGGWELTGIATLTTGAPFRVFYGTDLWQQGGRSRRYTDRIKDGNLGGGATVERWYDTSAFTAPGIANPDVPGQRMMDSRFAAEPPPATRQPGGLWATARPIRCATTEFHWWISRCTRISPSEKTEPSTCGRTSSTPSTTRSSMPPTATMPVAALAG